MALFSITKKQEEKKPQGSSFPEFPEFPKLNEREAPEFPAYEPSISDIKNEITKSDFQLPVREKKAEPKMFAASSMPSKQVAPVEETVAPEVEESSFSPSSPRSSVTEDHMLFVKIDRYKEAMKDIDHLKIKISEAEKILSSLEQLKAEEDSKLGKWGSEMQELKQKLMALDKHLFE